MGKFSIVLVAGLSALSFSAFAGDDSEPADLTQPVKFGDQAMSCQQITGEVADMETRLGGSPASSLMDGEQAVQMGTGLAQRAAIAGGAGGTAVATIGKVGGLLGASKKKKKQREAEQRAIAEKRWLYMVGLYQGRDCDRQLAAASANAPAVADTAPSDPQ